MGPRWVTSRNETVSGVFCQHPSINNNMNMLAVVTMHSSTAGATMTMMKKSAFVKRILISSIDNSGPGFRRL